jgi:hypothetical protein
VKFANKIKSGVLCLCFLWVVGYAGSAYSADPMLVDLDRAYYYPDQEGLRSMTAGMKVEQLNPSTRSYFNLPEIRVEWSAGDQKLRFTLKDTQISGETAEYVLNVVENFKQMIFPSTLEKQLESYQSTIEKEPTGTVTAKFKARSKSSQITDYNLWIDTARRRIQKMQIAQSDGPTPINIEFAYTIHEGKWQIEESRAQFHYDGYDFEENTRFSFVKEKEFWLVRKIDQKLKRNGILIQSYILTLDPIQVN